MTIPSNDMLFTPVLQAIKRLGGSASIAELDSEVIKSLSLTDEDATKMHNERQTELVYRLGWVRTALKGHGLLNNSGRGVWAITPVGMGIEGVDPGEIKPPVRQNRDLPVERSGLVEAEEALEQNWKDEALARLRVMPPEAFERLCQRLLRESGFEEVKVTGKSGDGGIDGECVMRLGGFLALPVVFQCKRYQGSVSSPVVRDFRGAMMGRAERGLLLTTGTFTRDAKVEAVRAGAHPIDLEDSDQLLDKLKEFRLGVDVEMIEKVSVRPNWFEEF